MGNTRCVCVCICVNIKYRKLYHSEHKTFTIAIQMWIYYVNITKCVASTMEHRELVVYRQSSAYRSDRQAVSTSSCMFVISYYGYHKMYSRYNGKKKHFCINVFLFGCCVSYYLLKMWRKINKKKKMRECNSHQMTHNDILKSLYKINILYLKENEQNMGYDGSVKTGNIHFFCLSNNLKLLLECFHCLGNKFYSMNN